MPAVGLAAVACQGSNSARTSETRPTPTPTPAPSAVPIEEAQESAPSAEEESADVEPAAHTTTEHPSVDANGEIRGDVLVDSLVDVAPAAPATPFAGGVVLISRSEEVVLAPLAALSKSRKPAPSPLQPVTSRAGPFPVARGPAIFQQHAYWASQGKLYRRHMPSTRALGALETLASDAAPGARVAVPGGAPELLNALPATVAYIARADASATTLIARLWTEHAPSQVLSPDGGSTLSVTLTARPGGLWATSLQGRTGTSTLHVRTIDLRPGAAPSLSADHAVWVGGSTNALTEVVAEKDSQRPVAFLAVERDISHFGLLTLELQGTDLARPKWLNYANGLDPAPIAVAHLCGKKVLLRAEPATSAPGAPQSLLLTSQDSPADIIAVLATSRAFFDAALAELPGGALLTYVADRRTWARTLRCVSAE